MNAHTLITSPPPVLPVLSAACSVVAASSVSVSFAGSFAGSFVAAFPPSPPHPISREDIIHAHKILAISFFIFFLLFIFNILCHTVKLS